MIATNDKTIAVLNDLIEINNDRVTGYEKAAEEAKNIDVDLQGIFHKMADESRRCKAELAQEVINLGGEASTDSTNLGKIYRAWMDVKATFTGKDRHAILSSCEYGEDAAQKAYKEALGSDAEIDTDTRQLIVKQQETLKISHDLIKKYRDINK
ncbi:MAG: PA2169 family four-helix-bundle protein [Ferruginibacter sp.]